MRWNSFLNESIGDKESIAALRRWMGALLNPDGIPQDFSPRLMILVGYGPCGKSTLIHLLTDLVSYSCSCFSGISFKKALRCGCGRTLEERRLHIIDSMDTRMRDIEDVCLIKSIISGDKIIYRQKYKKKISELYPKCLFVAAVQFDVLVNNFYNDRWILKINMKPVKIPEPELLKNLIVESDGIYAWARGDREI